MGNIKRKKKKSNKFYNFSSTIVFKNEVSNYGDIVNSETTVALDNMKKKMLVILHVDLFKEICLFAIFAL